MDGLLDGIKYNKSFLKQVIFRIDFSEPVENEVVFCERIISAIQSNFPKTNMQRLIRYGGIEVKVDADGISNRISPNGEGRELTYCDAQNNKVIISNLAIVFEYNNYNTYEQMRAAIGQIINELWARKTIITSRIGMRYVNLYNYDTDMPKVNKAMFSTGIRGSFQQTPLKCSDEIEPIRVMMTTEYKRGDMRINLRSGLHNRTYPAKISRDDFVVDIDCFVSTGIDKIQDIYSFMNTAHASIQELFEASITDKLRGLME